MVMKEMITYAPSNIPNMLISTYHTSLQSQIGITYLY